MALAARTVSMTMAAVLLWAGLEKARDPSAFVAVLRALGVADRAAGVAGGLVTGLELSVGVGLIFRPHAALTLAALLGLAASFALAGGIAFLRHQDIPCGCFGLYGEGRLGRDQLTAFPLWLAGAALLRLNGAEWAAGVGAGGVFALVALSMAALRGFGGVRAAWAARGDRRSAREMFVWLNR